MSAPILVTGATGTLGRRVVPRLLAAGHDVRVLTRRAPEDAAARVGAAGVDVVVGDLATGDGVAAAVDGVATILHLAGSASGDEEKARTLVDAASRAGVGHLVHISVVGADRVPVVGGIDRALFGYFAAKRAAERVVAESGIPWTTLRATQFHDAMLTVARATARMPVMPVFAGTRFQPIDTDEVAARLVELALGAPAGLLPEMAGPEILPMAELVRRYVRAAGRRRRAILPIRLPGAAARAFRAGADLAPEHAVGRRTWAEFLADEVATTTSRPLGRPAATAG